MASVTTRVELHGATEANYEMLHAAMEREGFARTVRADDGVWYHLPPAEYVHNNVLSRADALDRAKRAASQTGRTYTVWVAGWDGSWTGHNMLRVS